MIRREAIFPAAKQHKAALTRRPPPGAARPDGNTGASRAPTPQRDGTGQDREARLGPARPAARPASAGPALTEAAPRRAAAAAPPPGDVPAAPAARRAALTPALLSHACAAQAQCERSAAEGRRGTDSEGAGRGRAARERTGSGRAARGFLRPLRRGSYLPLSAPAQSARPDARAEWEHGGTVRVRSRSTRELFRSAFLRPGEVAVTFLTRAPSRAGGAGGVRRPRRVRLSPRPFVRREAAGGERRGGTERRGSSRAWAAIRALCGGRAEPSRAELAAGPAASASQCWALETSARLPLAVKKPGPFGDVFSVLSVSALRKSRSVTASPQLTAAFPQRCAAAAAPAGRDGLQTHRAGNVR